MFSFQYSVLCKNTRSRGEPPENGSDPKRMAAFILDIGDHVALREGSILDLGGGFRVEGPDAGEVIEISVGMDVVAIQWEQAQFRGWYDVETLSRLVRVDTPTGALLRLSEAEMLHFASIQDLLTRLGFEEDQEHACLRQTKHGHVIEFDRITGQSVSSFVAQGIRDGWLRSYLKEKKSGADGI